MTREKTTKDANIQILKRFLENRFKERIKPAVIGGEFMRPCMRCNLQRQNAHISLKDKNNLAYDFVIKTKKNLEELSKNLKANAPSDFDFDVDTCKIKLKIVDKKEDTGNEA